jgi:hypothetical protein
MVTEGEGSWWPLLAPVWGLAQLAVIALQIFCIIHVIRTRREFWWILIILFFPLIGSLIYIFVEVRPQATHRRWGAAGPTIPGGGRRAVERLEEELRYGDTVERRIRLAEAYRLAGDLPKAVAMYESCLKGVHAEDPAVLYPLAAAHVANGTFPEAIDALGRLQRTGSRDYVKERTLLEGRAHEGMGNLPRAAELYESIVKAYPGEEPRVRLAAVREQQGRPDDARALYQETVFRTRRADHDYRSRQRQWIAIAKRKVKELTPKA